MRVPDKTVTRSFRINENAFLALEEEAIEDRVEGVGVYAGSLRATSSARPPPKLNMWMICPGEGVPA